MNNHEIYFINFDLNIINRLVLRFINNKIKIIDPADFNTKIKIKKNINQKSKKGIKILNFLGYNTDNTNNIILHCIYYKKSYLFNKKISESLLIINSYQDFEEFNKNMMIYKYNIQNKLRYIYDCTMKSIESN